MILGGVEAGGTKFVCVVADGDGTLLREARIRTRTPGETLAEVIAFFREAADDGMSPMAIGIGAFGPLELRPVPGIGRIVASAKPGWSGVDLVEAVRGALDVAVAIDTDVAAAALAEARWGAAQGLWTFVYLTVGTGIGGAAVVDGSPIRGLVHPEMGHISVRREPDDAYAGHCPFHRDCWEGLACGPAIADRWGAPAEEITGHTRGRMVDLEARYLAAGIADLTLTLAPERVVIGGGVSRLPGLVEAIGRYLRVRLETYPGLAEHRTEGFVVPAALGQMAGPRGALILAERALR